MRRLLLVLLATLVLPLAAQQRQHVGPAVDLSHGPLRVSDNGRFLQHADGTPFLYLADTAWELFHRLTREETEQYLEMRRRQGFTVIQAVALAELDGLNVPNAYGERPLIDNDPTEPNEKYFAHVDWVVSRAADKGLVIGLLPTWGDKVVTESWGKGPVIFTAGDPAGARSYGRFLGARYKERPNLIWILGGDRNPKGYEAVWDAMADGIKSGGSAHLMTYHPNGGGSSATSLHEKAWLDFNMIQSGHSARDGANYRMIAADYARTPVKPVLDGEPRYEDHPVDWKPQEKGWFDDADVRQALYWSVFAGGFGVTYGCHPIWQMKTAAREPVGHARNNWQDVLEVPGAWDVLHLRALLLSAPMLERVPDQSLIADDAGSGPAHVRATRGRRYAWYYLPTGAPVTAQLGKIQGETVKASWFDPRTGETAAIGAVPNQGTKRFAPPGTPGRGDDWVLVLETP